MSVAIPKIKKPDSRGTLHCIYAIAISPDMEEQIKILKAKYGPRWINEWLRNLWQMGLKDHFEETKGA